MAKTHGKAKGRRDAGGYMAIPHAVLDSDSFLTLSGIAMKVLICIYRQYNGRNNGDLCAPFSYAKALNIGSQSTWYNAIKELIEADLIRCTRNSLKKGLGNPHGLCALFAVTWQNIDECKGKLDCSPTTTPPRKFSIKNSISSGANSVASHYENCSDSLQNL